jgi:hypothetical protein
MTSVVHVAPAAMAVVTVQVVVPAAPQAVTQLL